MFGLVVMAAIVSAMDNEEEELQELAEEEMAVEREVRDAEPEAGNNEREKRKRRRVALLLCWG